MVRCLLGLVVITAGLVALTSASATKETPFSIPQPTPNSGTHLREMEVVAASGISRTLLLPAPVFGASFSLN